jgi:serine/arginine repetitive matrix protein 2
MEPHDTTSLTNPLAMVRLRVVESLLTPASVAPEHRPNSYAGETTLITDNNNDQLRHQNQPESSPTLGVSGEARARVFSGLQPPSSDATRTSFMTTSTASRMSGLSDFPVPPKDDRHVSLGTFFNESFAQSELQSEIPLLPPDRQVVFGGNQNAGDLAKTLSSSSLSSN